MADEIGRAFQKVGGSASALQVPFEQVSAWIAVVSSKTRESAESIGTSFKAILARIQNMKEYGFDEEDGTKVNEVAKSLATVGIQLMDTNGQFRNTGVLMDQLGKKWDNLDSRTKAYLATTIAGTRQQSRFYALMDGYSEATELYINALNSAGVATQKFGIYQESTQAKMDKFNSTLNTFWQNAIDSDTIKSVIDLGTIFIELIIKIVDKIGIIIPTLTALGLVLTFLSGTFRGLTGSVISTTAGLMGLTFATQAERTAMTGAALATALFSNALKSIPGVALISALTIGAGLLAEWAINAFTAKNKTKELTDEYNKSIQSIKENDFSLNDKFSSLDSGIQNNIIKFFNNLKSINEDLNFDNFMSGIDATKLIAFQDALDKFKDNGNIDELNGSLESLYDHLIDVAKQNGVTGDSAKLFANQFIKMQNPIEYAKYSLTQFTGVLEGLKNQTITTANAINIMEKLLSTTVSEETIKRIALHNDEISKLKDKAGAYALAKVIAQEELDANPSGDDQFGITSKFLGKTPTKSKIGASIAYGTIVNKYQEIFDQFLTNKSILGSSENTTLPHDFSDLPSSSAKDQYQTDQYEQALAALNQQLSILSYNKSKLSQTSSEYRNIISQEIALYKQQQDLAHQEADRLRAKLASGSLDQKEIDETKKTIDDLGDTWLDLQKTIDDLNFETVTSNLSKFDNQISILKDNLSTYKSQLDLLSPSSSEYDSKLQEIINTTKEYAQVLKNKQLLTEQELLNDKLTILQKEELQNKLREINKEQIQLQIELQSQLASLANETIQIYKDVYEAQKDAAISAIDEQMEAEEDRHKQITDNLDDELDQYKDIIQAKLDAIDKSESEYDYNKDLTQLQKERQEIQNKLNSLKLDDSDWATSQKEDLTKQLNEKDLAIQEKQHDRSIELQKDNLNYLLDSYESESDAKKEAEDGNYDAVKDSLDKQKKEVEKYWNNIINDDQKFSNIRRNIIAGNLDGIQSDFEDFSSILSNKSEILGESITNNLINKMKEITPALQAAKSELDDYTSINNGYDSGSNSSNNNSGSSSEKTLTKGMTLRDAASVAGVSIDYDKENKMIILNGKKYFSVPGTSLNSSGYNVVDNPELVKQLLKNVGGSFHTGGIIGEDSGSSSPSRITQLVNKLFNLKPNEQVVTALKNEIMIPQNNIPNFISNIQNMVSGLQPIVAGGGDTNYHLSLRIDNINGDNKNAGNEIFSQIVSGLKRMGK